MPHQILFFASAEIGYAEVNIQTGADKWHTGFGYLLLALSSMAGVAASWWYTVPILWWSIRAALLRGTLTTVGIWAYIHWVCPLQYESVAIKRGIGVELCTRWRLFERSDIVKFKDLTAVTIQEVALHQLRLLVKARGDRIHTCFKHTTPGLMDLLDIYSTLAELVGRGSSQSAGRVPTVMQLPRQVRKGRLFSLQKEPGSQWAFSRWLLRQWDFTSAGCSTIWTRVAAWARASYYCLLRWKHRVVYSETYGQAASWAQPYWELCQLWAAAAGAAALAQGAVAWEHLKKLLHSGASGLKGACADRARGQGGGSSGGGGGGSSSRRSKGEHQQPRPGASSSWQEPASSSNSGPPGGMARTSSGGAGGHSSSAGGGGGGGGGGKKGGKGKSKGRRH